MGLYTVDGLPAGANAAAFTPMPPPAATNPASSSWGIVSRTVSGALNSWEPSPPPASVARYAGAGGNPGQETGVWKPILYVARALGEYILPTHREELPMPALNVRPAGAPPPVAAKRPRFTGRGQIAWPRAYQRFPPIAGSGGPS